MAEIKPFKGILYNSEEVKDLTLVTAPPYDVISPDEQERYYHKSTYNIIRLILGKELPGNSDTENKYARAARFFREWLAKGILKEELQSHLYLYEQQFKIESQLKTRRGFIALMRLEDYSSGKVLPHEKTFPKPKEDRLNLMRACKANFSCVFGLYADEGKAVGPFLAQEAKKKPVINIADDEGVTHRFWRITDPQAIKKICEAMCARPIFIADGHHRYGAALALRDEMRKDPYNYTMICFVDIDDPGLIILPTHRLIKTPVRDLKLFETYFEVKEFPNKDQMLKEMAAKGKTRHIIGLYNKKYYALTLKDERVMDEVVRQAKPAEWKRLDVTILHFLILEYLLKASEAEGEIAYTKNADEAIKLVDTGQFQTAFFLNPTQISQVKSIASQKEMMPQKSTYFYPKLLSGLVMRKIE